MKEMSVVVSTTNKAPTVRDEAEELGESAGDPTAETVNENFWPCSQWLLTVQMM
jgi:hypothetical protein